MMRKEMLWPIHSARPFAWQNEAHGKPVRVVAVLAYMLGHKTNRDIYSWFNFVLYDALALNKTIINYLSCNICL